MHVIGFVLLVQFSGMSCIASLYLSGESAEGPKHDTQRYFHTLSQASFARVTTFGAHPP